MLFPAFAELRDSIDIAAYMMDKLIINRNILDDEHYRYLFSVEEVNKLVLKGIPFRDAYKQIAKEIANGKFKPEKKVHHTHIGSIGNLSNDKIKNKMKKNMERFRFEKINQSIEKILIS